jgi:thiol-disulfide isomerase/thioredoxin
LHWSVKSPLTSSRSVPLRPAPGEKIHVDLGEGGIEVTGQLAAENQLPNFDYHFALNYLVARRPGIEPPDFLAGKGFDRQHGWNDSWLHSSEGGAYFNTLHHWFVKPEPDGRFRISGVEPGAYDFAVNLYGTTEGCLVHPIAMGVIHFTVTPGRTQLDLGKVSIPSIKLPKVGDLAADFEITAPDGSKSRLAALRGKYVLIDFWATWCGPCVAKLDEVERLRKELGPDRLVVVGANLDSDATRARDFLKSKPLPWQHALLGDWSSTDVPRRYAISNVPAYVLIDPAGRILTNEYWLETIETQLKVLEKK